MKSNDTIQYEGVFFMCRCTNLYAQYRLINDRCMFEHKIRKTKKKLCFPIGRQFNILRFVKWMLFELCCIKWQMIRTWRTILFLDEKREEKIRSNMRAISKCQPNPIDRISVNSNQISVHNSFEWWQVKIKFSTSYFTSLSNDDDYFAMIFRLCPYDGF